MAQKCDSHPRAGLMDLPGHAVGKRNIGEHQGGKLGQQGSQGNMEGQGVPSDVARRAPEADKDVGRWREEDGGPGLSGVPG